MNSPLDQLLTVNQTAEYLGVSRASIYRLLKTDGLPAVRIGSMLRFKQSDLLQYVERHSFDAKDLEAKPWLAK